MFLYCGCTHSTHLELRGQLWASLLYFYHMCPGGHTQVLRLGIQHWAILPAPTMAFDQIYSTGCEFPPVEWISKQIINQSAIPQIIVLLLHQRVDLVHSWVSVDEFFPLPQRSSYHLPTLWKEPGAGSFQLSTILIPLFLVIKVCVVFSNRILPCSFSRQPREMARACVLWGSSETPLSNNS